MLATVPAGMLTAKERGPVTAALADWRKTPELKRFERALAFLQDPASRRLAAGKHAVEGDSILANVVRDATRDPSSAQLEAHRKYADIHFLVSGSEMIGYAPADGLKVTKEYSETDDVLFYALPPRYTRIVLQPGRLALFLPGQPHLPGCHAGQPGQIHKIVMKIRI